LKLPTFSRTEIYAGTAACALGALAAVGAAVGGKLGIIGVVGVLALIVATYVGMYHPLWLVYTMVVTVTTLPFGSFPGVHLPIYLVCGAGAMLALLLYPRHTRRHSALMSAVLVLIVLSGLSMVVTYSSPVNIVDFAKWALATGAMFVLLALPNDELVKIGKAIVYACAFSGLVGLVSVAQGTTRWAFKPFAILGYHADDHFYFTGATQSASSSGGRFDLGQNSQTFQRLGGLWADPNGAGIGLVIGLAIAAIVFVGWQRVTLMSLLSVCILLTLSRAALISVLVGAALVFVFHNMRARDRQIMIGTLFVAGATAMLIPAVRTRLMGSLGENDAGASDRIAAIREFPWRLGNHWIFGRGWSLREFKDGPYAFEQNFVSNAPLIAVHRGGLVAGLAFVAVIIVGCIVAAKLIRSDSLPHAFFGGVFMAFSIIALNLDHPVVVIPQMAFMYTFFLVFLQYSDELRRSGALDSPQLAAVPKSVAAQDRSPQLPAASG